MFAVTGLLVVFILAHLGSFDHKGVLRWGKPRLPVVAQVAGGAFCGVLDAEDAGEEALIGGVSG